MALCASASGLWPSPAGCARPGLTLPGGYATLQFLIERVITVASLPLIIAARERAWELGPAMGE